MKYLLLIALSVNVCFANEINDMRLQFGVMVGIDAMQTMTFLKNGAVEDNPILSENPSNAKVLTYMAISGSAVIALSYIVPKKYREPVIYIANIVQADIVGRNIKLGYGVSF